MKTINKKLCQVKNVNSKIILFSYGKPLDSIILAKFMKMNGKSGLNIGRTAK